MLDDFMNCEDFPQQTVYIYKFGYSFDTSTGVRTKAYQLQESRDVWILPQSSAKKVFTDKVVDTLSNMMITDTALESTDVVNYSETWYNCVISDDILFSGKVVQVGLTKITKPDVIDTEAETEFILGDSYGVAETEFVLGDSYGVL